MAKSAKVQVAAKDKRLEELLKELKVPEDFDGVLQLNIQAQRESESIAVTAVQQQVVTQIQNLVRDQLQPIQITITAIQNQNTEVQVILGQLQSQLQAIQNQMQLLFLAVLGSGAAGEGEAERRELLRQVVERLREPPGENG